jgi:hypothetical protein
MSSKNEKVYLDEDEDERDDRLERERIKRIKEKEKQLSQVNTKNIKLYNLDKKNGVEFKRAYYKAEDGNIAPFNVMIDYDGKPAKITKITSFNRKILNISLVTSKNELIQIGREQLSVCGTPVQNFSIIRKIMLHCLNQKIESDEYD